MLAGITLIILSLIAIPSILFSKRPNAQVVLNKLVSYQGLIGVVFTFWGVYGIITTGILATDGMNKWPIYWISLLIANILLTELGFMLGYGMISKYVFSKNEIAKIKGVQHRARLAPIQGKLGLLGIGVGVWVIVASYVFH